MKKNIYIKDLFNQRNFFMGFAMLWIVLFHSELSINIPYIEKIFHAIKGIGYGGVDIFLFCSSIGCYHSLNKNSDYLSFIKRRFWRLYPTYFIFITIWIIYKEIYSNISFNAIIGNYFCIQNFTSLGNDFNWYISAIWLFYLLTPYLYCLCNQLSLKYNLFVILLLILFSIVFWNNNTLIITISRLPIFYTGLLFVKYKNTLLNINKIYLSILITFLGTIFLFFNVYFFSEYLWSHALFWYPFILITPGLCIILFLLTQILIKIKLKYLIKFVSYIGKISFEIYLIHILAFSILQHFKITNNLSYCIIIIFVILISSIYNKFISFLLQKLNLNIKKV